MLCRLFSVGREAWILVNVGGVQATLCADHVKSIPVVEVNGLGKLVGPVAGRGVGLVLVGGPRWRGAGKIEWAGEQVCCQVDVVCDPGGKGVALQHVFHLARRDWKGCGQQARRP